jgi:glycosyltransferase involved in cell wall biosynthesis
MIEEITPVIITYNEAPNIARTLNKLVWAKRIVVVDSGSNDETLDIIRSYPQAQVVYRPFDDCANQWNFGNNQVDGGWILSLDADYELSDEIIAELGGLRPTAATSGYRAQFVYRIFGRPLRGSLYPPRIVLYRKDKAYYRNEGHTQQLVVAGSVLPLFGVIFHDDRKSLRRWLGSQRRYAREEAEYLLRSDGKSLSRVDRMRLVGWPAPIAILVYTLLLKGCIFEGWPGWYYVLQRLLAETLLALEIVDRRLRWNVDPRPGSQ